MTRVEFITRLRESLAGLGFGALLYLALEWLVKGLGRYARLHYRVLQITEHHA